MFLNMQCFIFEEFHKMFKKVSLKSSLERELPHKDLYTQPYLWDLGVIINGIENFIERESMIEDSVQAMETLKLEGIAVTKRKCHEFLENLQKSIQESHQLSRSLQDTGDMLISIFSFVVSMKRYTCSLRCSEGSLIICFKFPAVQPPDARRKEKISNDVRNLILKNEHLSFYGLPNADSLHCLFEDIDETSFTGNPKFNISFTLAVI